MKINPLITEAEKQLFDVFSRIESIALENQNKVLNGFKENRIALRHFAPTTGYGYDDVGRDTLGKLYSYVFDAESALVSPLIANGTHAISTVLFGLLRPGDIMYSVTGNPYDTLLDVVSGENIGSLKDYGVSFEKTDLNNGAIDFDAIEKKLTEISPKIVFIQRSRGYNWRSALSIQDIEKIVNLVRKFTDASIVVDNCYGEFTDICEPTGVGADVIVGSLIKNPGGGIAPTGGYIAGKAALVEQISYRLTAPGIGSEVGSYAFGYQYFYQGFFLAPHVVSQALKAAALFSYVMTKIGYKTLPEFNEKQNDIITSIQFNTAEELIAFCQTVQSCSPVDSHVEPQPWDMPGYKHQVIMAAGAFVEGSSIEMSADAPIKEPYIAYFQGSLTYEHAKIALNSVLSKLGY